MAWHVLQLFTTCVLFDFQSCGGAREATCCTNSAAASADIDTEAEGEVIWVYPANLNEI